MKSAGSTNARLVFDSMVELAAIHEIVRGPEGQAVDYRILDCNAAFSRTTGIQRDAAVGRLASEVYGTAPPHLDVYARVAATGEPARFDAHFLPLDRRFSISVVSPRRGYFSTIASDITDRHRDVEVLRRYQLLAEHGNDILLFVRRDDGRILEANTAAVAAYGVHAGRAARPMHLRFARRRDARRDRGADGLGGCPRNPL